MEARHDSQRPSAPAPFSVGGNHAARSKCKFLLTIYTWPFDASRLFDKPTSSNATMDTIPPKPNMDEQPSTPHRRQSSTVPSLATMPPVHDYPQAMAENNRRGLIEPGSDRSDEHHTSVAPSNPHSNQEESWTQIAFLIFVGLVLTAMSILFQLLTLAYFLWISERRVIFFRC